MRMPSLVPLVLAVVLLSVLSAGESNSSTKPCGKRTLLPFAFVYGSNVFRGQFPWHVAIYNNAANRNSEFLCGGSIVTSSFIVSAAHCLDDWQRPELYFFTTGIHDKQKPAGTSSYNVSEIILHPEFNRSILINDIALLRSDGGIAYTAWTVLPICLPRDDAGLDFSVKQLIDTRGLVTGWESPHILRKSNILQSTTMIVIDVDSCRTKIPQHNHSPLDNSTMFCARGWGIYDKICSANGGGGIFYNHGGTWYLRGIISFTPRKEFPDGSIGCDPDSVLGFTNVARYTEWIDGHLGQ